MASIEYTNPHLVSDVRSDDRTPRNPYVTGYGSMIRTRHWVKYAGRWHRVYAMCYGNGASAYIRSRGKDLFLDVDTEHRIA